jgi:hypothetical protein
MSVTRRRTPSYGWISTIEKAREKAVYELFKAVRLLLLLSLLTLQDEKFLLVRTIWLSPYLLSRSSTLSEERSDEMPVMGIPKDLYLTDKDADDNALTMPILPKRNHKKQTFMFFWLYDGADDLSTTNDQDFSIDPFKACGDIAITQLFFRCPTRR